MSRHVLFVVFCLLLLSCFDSTSLCQSQNEGNASVDIYLSDLDLDAKLVSTRIWISYDIPVNRSWFWIDGENAWFRDGKKYRNNYLEINVSRKKASGDYYGYFDYFGELDKRLSLFGYSEFYPYDRYFLNLSFHLYSFGTYNASDIDIDVSFFEHAFDEEHTISIFSLTGAHKVSIQITLFRETWTYGLQEYILTLAFALFGGLLLIHSDLKLRISVSIPLYVFAITFLFSLYQSARIPECTFSVTFFEARILLFITGISLIVIFSLIAHRFGTIWEQYKYMVWLICDVLALYLLGDFSYTMFSAYEERALVYPWLDFHPSLWKEIMGFPIIVFLLRILLDFIGKYLQIPDFERYIENLMTYLSKIKRKLKEKGENRTSK